MDANHAGLVKKEGYALRGSSDTQAWPCTAEILQVLQTSICSIHRGEVARVGEELDTVAAVNRRHKSRKEVSG